MTGWRAPGGSWLAADALALWAIARCTAGSLTAIMERRFAGLGLRGPTPSGWSLATVAASLGAVILLLAYALLDA